ncbi:8736_t:CDS:2 [Diversispora eburnea]|uniref:8736_t:CDS:1 n=1 Tax=Diversispora eburnea TaxID=1213867 RepID=A0A9N9BZB8_9GLOM|nr:8736_t:CDS:2 [Diversispora eburnea]
MSYRRTTLFVAGFGSQIRARDLAYEFERYGRLIRCDIPAPRSYQSKPYAFVEFEDERDAEDAYYEMHGRRVYGHALNIQWAKNAPSRSWRYEERTNGEDDRRSRSRSRSISPREEIKRESRSASRVRDEARDRSPRERTLSPNGRPASRSLSPHRSSSQSPHGIE